MLREILATDVFKLLLVFARLGAGIMLLPGIGSAMVSTRARLLLALAIAFLLQPTLGASLPPMPQDLWSLFFLVLQEVTIGIFFGVLIVILMSALDLAGNFIGYSVGLTNAFVMDPVSQEQAQILTGFLDTTAVTLVLVTDTHHLMLRALVDSYALFQPGNALPVGDFSDMLIRTAGRSFLVGLQLSAPLVVFSLIFNCGLGLLNRLVPQMQVFFVGMPIQILGGLSLLMLCLPPLMLWFLHYLGEGLGVFLAPG
jgi:flagellar biosynthetic protein FliR